MEHRYEEEIISRSIELLEAAKNLIRDNRLEAYTTFYDEATCDGQCLIDDINIVLSMYRSQVLAENATTQKETE